MPDLVSERSLSIQEVGDGAQLIQAKSSQLHRVLWEAKAEDDLAVLRPRDLNRGLRGAGAVMLEERDPSDVVRDVDLNEPIGVAGVRKKRHDDQRRTNHQG